jgi:hypothetical protein
MYIVLIPQGFFISRFVAPAPRNTAPAYFIVPLAASLPQDERQNLSMNSCMIRNFQKGATLPYKGDQSSIRSKGNFGAAKEDR